MRLFLAVCEATRLEFSEVSSCKGLFEQGVCFFKMVFCRLIGLVRHQLSFAKIPFSLGTREIG